MISSDSESDHEVHLRSSGIYGGRFEDEASGVGKPGFTTHSEKGDPEASIIYQICLMIIDNTVMILWLFIDFMIVS